MSIGIDWNKPNLLTNLLTNQIVTISPDLPAFKSMFRVIFADNVIDIDVIAQ